MVVFVVLVDYNMTILPLKFIFDGVDMDAPLKLKEGVVGVIAACIS